MTEVEIAERIAREAHAGQVDKQGQPYILHVERVAAAVSEPAKAAAWLHDVLEDCPEWSYRRLTTEGVSARMAGAAHLLRRNPLDNYYEYIELIALSGDPLAIEIKLADLRDNLRYGCPETLRPRYQQAIARLERKE